MSSKFILECIFELPDEPFERAKALTRIEQPWNALTDALGAVGLPFEQRAETVEPRSEPKSTTALPKRRVSRTGKPLGRPPVQPKPTQPVNQTVGPEEEDEFDEVNAAAE